MSSDPFAPLGGKPAAQDEAKQRSIVVPVPPDAPAPPKHRMGNPTASWRYVDQAGALLGFVHRYDSDDGKQFRPQTLWRDAQGVLSWRFEAWPIPRPLYGLDLLAANPAALVVVTEGEKAADAGRRLLPGCVVITSPNGSKSAGKADWSPLRGRRVVLWPDADAAGADFVAAVAKCLKSIAASIAMVVVPEGCGDGWDAADAEEEGWTQARAAALIDGAGPCEAVKTSEASEGASRRRENRADALMAALSDLELWHDADAVGYVSFDVRGHRENWPLRSSTFKRWLANFARLQSGQVPTSQGLDDVIRTLEAIAINEGPLFTPFLRVGEADDAVYFDLCDDGWRAVKVTPQGWSVVVPPVKFIRTPAMRPMPEPEAGEGIERFRDLVNVKTDADFMLTCAWLVAALRPKGPYPILVVNGEQGTGKSSFARMLRLLIDPSAAPIRATPKDDRDLIVSAMNSHILAFDNLSSVPEWLSDALCRISTGGGFATRMLHTDRDEIICDVQRPIILNGIPTLTSREDLADRALNVHLEVIDKSQRRTEKDLYADFEARRPLILGSLFDAVCAALRNLDSVKLQQLPRMADFVEWTVAAETGLGWDPGEFEEVYNSNRSKVSEAAFEANPVAVAIKDLMAQRTEGVPWEGTPTELLNVLSPRVSEAVRRSRSWPTTPAVLGNKIERAKPLLREIGILVERHKATDRVITIVQIGAPEGNHQ